MPDSDALAEFNFAGGSAVAAARSLASSLP